MSRSQSRTSAPSARPARRGVRAVVVVLLALGLGGGTFTAVLAAMPSVAAPTITSKPADHASSTTASFSFTGPSRASFQCKLDAAAFATCTSPKSYTGLAQGLHTFQVKALVGSEQSSPTSYVWTVDTVAPPAPSITGKPASLSNSTTSTFSFSDAESQVSFRCRIDGSTFVACTNPRTYYNGSQGAHSFAVQAVDAAGNTGPSTIWSWSIDSMPPPAPVLTQKPSDPTPNATNTFAWTDSEAGVSFQCAIENGSWKACSSPYTYVFGTKENEQHQFAVRALDAAGNASAATSYTFKYHKGLPTSGIPFQITGTVSGMSIGVWKPISITLTNPNSVAIYVSVLNVAVATNSTPAGCPSASNIELQQSNVSASTRVLVPANGSVLLPSQGVSAPQIRLKNLPTVNQDVCKNKSFDLSYSGTANN